MPRKESSWTGLSSVANARLAGAEGGRGHPDSCCCRKNDCDAVAKSESVCIKEQPMQREGRQEEWAG